MAMLSRRLHRKNSSGKYDIIHFETTTNLVKRPGGGNMEDALITMNERNKKAETLVHSVCAIGDLRTTFAEPTPPGDWLPCDGSIPGVFSEDYPDLADILKKTVPYGTKIHMADTATLYSRASARIGTSAITYYNGKWVAVGNGYDINYPATLYDPIVYISKKDDPYGQWATCKVATDGTRYQINGIFYHATWNNWVIYGSEVTLTSTYNITSRKPCIFYASDPARAWTKLELSSLSGSVITGYSASGKMVLIVSIADGAGGVTQNHCLTFSSGDQTYTDTILPSIDTSSGIGIGPLTYGDGYWAFVEFNGRTLWYTSDPTGSWSAVTVMPDAPVSPRLENVAIGDGMIVTSGYQSSSGYGRIWYSNNIAGPYTDVGVLHTDSLHYLSYSNGIFVASDGPGRDLCILSDKCKRMRLIDSWYTDFSPEVYASAGDGSGTWVFMTYYNDIVIAKGLQFDAQIPELHPEIGKTYIRAQLTE